jgi:hypothetical protein
VIILGSRAGPFKKGESIRRRAGACDQQVPGLKPCRLPGSREKRNQERGAPASNATCRGHTEGQSNVEGAVEERGEQVLGLTQRLALDRTQALHSLHQSRELLL